MSAASTPEEPRGAARDRVAQAALALVQDGMAIGLGTGDTSRRFVTALGGRLRNEPGLRVTCASTSDATTAHARKCGLTVRPLPEFERLDLAFDGADEVDPQLDLIKGGGGAQTRERLVATAAASFVVLVDETKLVPVLGVRFPVAVEVLPEALRIAARQLEALGATVARRTSGPGAEEAPFVTDFGFPILDARFPRIEDPAALSAALDAIPGVVGHGLFAGLASLVLVGELGTTEVRRLPRTPGLRSSSAQGVTP